MRSGEQRGNKLVHNWLGPWVLISVGADLSGEFDGKRPKRVLVKVIGE